METREWTTVDKTSWGRGPWDRECDKRQWQDEATGLPCLMVRNAGGGNWCGYVGVPKGHPWHGVSYSGCARVPACEETYCVHRIDVDVHGGLTFSDRCTPHTREAWEQWRQRSAGDAEEAKRYPVGDAARRLKDAATRGAVADYDAFVTFSQSRFICHLPAPGESDDVWWFGFDCAHSGDCSPGYGRDSILNRGFDGYSQYRDAAYVAAECRRLAQQLRAQRVAASDDAPTTHDDTREGEHG